MKMSYFSQLLISVFGLLSVSFSFAQVVPLSPISPASGGQTPSQINIIGGYSEKYWTPQKQADQANANLFLFSTSPSFGDNLFASLIYSFVLQQETNPITFTNTTLSSLLTASAAVAQTTMRTGFITPFLLGPPQQLPVFVTFDPNSAQFKTEAAGTGEATQLANDKATSFYNYNALVSPAQYEINAKNPTELSIQEQQAEGFIKYITDQYDPMPVIDFSRLYKIDNEAPLLQTLNQPDVQQYLSALRKYAAIISVGLSNFDYLYNERKAYPTQQLLSSEGGSALADLPKGIHLPENLQKQASVLAIDKWMATRRLSWTTDDQGNKESWYNKMEKATPATLERENVMLLAEIRYELFKNRMVNEKILATLSTMELAGTQNQRTQISNIQRGACATDPLKSSGACPALTGPSAQATKVLQQAK